MLRMINMNQGWKHELIFFLVKYSYQCLPSVYLRSNRANSEQTVRPITSSIMLGFTVFRERPQLERRESAGLKKKNPENTKHEI